MELKSYQNNSFSAEDISIAIPPNNNNVNKKSHVSFANNYIIELKDVSLTFGKNKVFEKLNMKVPYGKIYTIIGPKRCGKTLILQSIVGLIKPTKGEIKVFDQKPEYSSAIGYMPQEMSLFDDLTINETMKYFGQLYDLPNDLVNNKIDFLIESLSVKNKNVFIRCLNNNDKVVVSMAAAIIHSPELLILDEPTIYGDPLLKKSVWKQLRSLCDNQKVTIIVSTTHMEEAQHSDILAIVRDGSLIEEEIPRHLTKDNKFNPIEDIFLNLFEKNKFKEVKEKIEMDFNSNKNTKNNIEIENNNFNDNKISSNIKFPKINTSSIDRISTLYYKNLKSKLRNINLLVFQLLYPAIAISLFCACIGHNANDIPVGVYNPDKPPFASDIVLKSINNKVISLQYYDNFDSAINGIKDHEVWAVLAFPSNYTRSMLERSLQGCEAPEEMIEYDIEDEVSEESVIHSQSHGYMKANNNTINSTDETTEETGTTLLATTSSGLEIEDDPEEDKGLKHKANEEEIASAKPIDSSDEREVNDYEEQEVIKPKLFTTIDLYMDNTNLLISGAVKAQVLMALKKARNRSIDLSMGSSHAPPIQIVDPVIYGSNEVEMSEFITPGIVIAITFLSSVLFPGLTIIRERNERQFERSTIAGVKVHELILSHLIIHMVILIIQIIFILICIFTIFNFPLIGSIYLVFLIIFIQGLNGLVYSIAISSFCCDQNQAIIVWLTTFSLLLIFGGIVWPIECLPRIPLIISQFLPQTIAGNGLRSVLSRGWDLSYGIIQISLLLPMVWIIILFVISILTFRIRK